MDWRHRSACLDEDPELYFPIGNTGPAILQIEEAKQVCRRCEVREQCLAWALEAGQDHGVWGGLSEDERRALKRRNARARVRTGACRSPQTIGPPEAAHPQLSGRATQRQVQAGPCPDPTHSRSERKTPLEFGFDERSDDRQAEAGRGGEIESRRKTASPIVDGHLEPLRRPTHGQHDVELIPLRLVGSDCC